MGRKSFMAMQPLGGDGEWQPIATAPFDRDLELAVIDYGEAHVLVFPCRRVLRGWTKINATQLIDVQPTHWREWSKSD